MTSACKEKRLRQAEEETRQRSPPQASGIKPLRGANTYILDVPQDQIIFVVSSLVNIDEKRGFVTKPLNFELGEQATHRWRN